MATLDAIERSLDARIACFRDVNEYYSSLLAAVKAFPLSRSRQGQGVIEEQKEAEVEEGGEDSMHLALNSVDDILAKARKGRGVEEVAAPKSEKVKKKSDKASSSSSSSSSRRSSLAASRTGVSRKAGGKEVPATRMRETKLSGTSGRTATAAAAAKEEKASVFRGATKTGAASSSSSRSPMAVGKTGASLSCGDAKVPRTARKQQTSAAGAFALDSFAACAAACAAARPRAYAMQGTGLGASLFLAQARLSSLLAGHPTLPPSAALRTLWSERMDYQPGSGAAAAAANPFQVLPKPLTVLLPVLYDHLGLQAAEELMARWSRAPSLSKLALQDVKAVVKSWYRLHLYFQLVNLCRAEMTCEATRSPFHVSDGGLPGGGDLALVAEFVHATPPGAPVAPPCFLGVGAQEMKGWVQEALRCIDAFYARLSSRVQYCVESSVGKATLRPLLRDLKESVIEAGGAAAAFTRVDLLKRYRAIWICLVQQSARIDGCIFVPKPGVTVTSAQLGR
jgi:hypothetical protein